ncbi:PfkB family carbohydrate kinase [Acidithiobacillus sulfuriphilus]|uniref:PfkB family carbohydrate kinase n=2 Tax=Acidithiobacillus sulfuriphilus TaxID=1867749 RepID=A0ACD5HRE4_9PROT|nr:PfkB family carbohydrate kinase [Acidithiobacillus sulfuriphilus]
MTMEGQMARPPTIAGRARREGLIFGECLFDHFPDGDRVGGAPLNVARHLWALGQQPLLVSRVGQDGEGARIRDLLHTWGMDARGLQEDPQYPTGSVEVLPDAVLGHQFLILPRQAYDRIAWPAQLPALSRIAFLYHGTLALREPGSRGTWERLTGQSDWRFVDLNLRAPWWTSDLLATVLPGTRVLKLNADELGTLAQAFSLQGGGRQSRVADLAQRFAIGEVVITHGAEGAVAWAGGLWQECPAPVVRVEDSVGAGDAFAAVWMVGILHGWPVDLRLIRAQALAAAICTVRGALPSDSAFYAPFLRDWGLHP